MPIKSRYPDRDFSHRPYLLWLRRVYAWLLTQVGESDYPAHEVAELPGLIDALDAAILDWEAKDGVVSDRSKFYTDVANALEKQLRLLKHIIPTVIDPHVMGSFGLEDSLPDSRDELGGVAEICINHWNEVIDDGVPPEYEPLEPQFNALITLFGDFEMMRTNYYSSFNLAQQAQNVVLEARAACHAKERDIFHWYNGFYPDSEAEFWTGTEWGTSSGGGGGGTGWDKKPVGKMSIPGPPLNGILAGCETYTGTDRFDIRIAWAKKNEPAPEMPLVDTYTDIEQPVFLDAMNFPLQKNFVYYVWIRARKGNEVSDWSDPVGIEWTEEAIPR